MNARKTAELPLHNGSAPTWLHRRMVEMAGAITTLIVRDEGPVELLRRLSNPFWFQAFGSALGFDWHSSGVTTTVCAALKEAAKRHGRDMGVVVCGGKGVTSRKTHDEIRRACEHTGDRAEPLIYASRLSAKVDSVAVQDGYDLEHHSFFFAPGTNVWCVVQQGMRPAIRYARRYHWFSEQMPSFVSDPHAAIACDKRCEVLNLVAGESERHRQAITALTREDPERILREAKPLLQGPAMPLFDGIAARRKANGPAILRMPAKDSLEMRDLQPASIKKVLLKTYERQACDFEELIGESGVGAQSLRSLSLLAELIYQAPASRRDPAVYSFAHGGKDGRPYPVNRKLYDANIESLRRVIDAAKVGRTEKLEALRALATFCTRISKETD